MLSASSAAPASPPARFDISLFSQPTTTGPEPPSTDVSTPEPYTPPRCTVPTFPPIRAGRRGGVSLMPRRLRFRRKPLVLALAVAAAALAVSAAHGSPTRSPGHAHGPAPSAVAAQRVPDVAQEIVRAPVRITDAAAVRLLRPGDRVDVLAAARVVASGARVVAVPEQVGGQDTSTAAEGSGLPTATADAGAAGGALVVLAVPRRIAAALSGAAMSSPLAVALC
ncbi:hypothetical protein JT723_23375 [Streptomyces bryophytorum]|nr:hypothetical protein [Actinacidiphila bryophytorum]MBN6541865.1 hypothetical protein [Actinacidiphila bryophytorum]